MFLGLGVGPSRKPCLWDRAAALGMALSTALDPASTRGGDGGEGMKFPEGAEGICMSFHQPQSFQAAELLHSEFRYRFGFLVNPQRPHLPGGRSISTLSLGTNGRHRQPLAGM